MAKKKEKESKGILIDALLAVFWFPFKALWKMIKKFCKWVLELPFKNWKLFLIIVVAICFGVWLISG